MRSNVYSLVSRATSSILLSRASIRPWAAVGPAAAVAAGAVTVSIYGIDRRPGWDCATVLWPASFWAGKFLLCAAVSGGGRQRKLLEIGQIFVLDVDLQRRQDAHHGAVEGNRQDQVGEALGVEFFAQVREGGIGNGQFRRHFTSRMEHGFGQRLQIGGAALRLGGDGADVVVADAEIAADLDVMGILIGRPREVADLED